MMQTDATESDAFTGMAGGTCRTSPQTAPIAIRMDAVQMPDGSTALMVFGTVSRASGIAKLELRSQAERHPLPLQGGAFAAPLPMDPATGVLAVERDPHVLVGFNAAGERVEAVNLDDVVVRATSQD